uniref:GPI-anchor transamidase n=1 Tax=Zonotrichia albicollis TaxID=44394 RepID=A0A8D2MM57_ZONAL
SPGFHGILGRRLRGRAAVTPQEPTEPKADARPVFSSPSSRRSHGALGCPRQRQTGCHYRLCPASPAGWESRQSSVRHQRPRRAPSSGPAPKAPGRRQRAGHSPGPAALPPAELAHRPPPPFRQPRPGRAGGGLRWRLPCPAPPGPAPPPRCCCWAAAARRCPAASRYGAGGAAAGPRASGRAGGAWGSVLPRPHRRPSAGRESAHGLPAELAAVRRLAARRRSPAGNTGTDTEPRSPALPPGGRSLPALPRGRNRGALCAESAGALFKLLKVTNPQTFHPLAGFSEIHFLSATHCNLYWVSAVPCRSRRAPSGVPRAGRGRSQGGAAAWAPRPGARLYTAGASGFVRIKQSSFLEVDIRITGQFCHIVLMLADDMACNPRNPKPATVFSHKNMELNVYGDDVEVDYRSYEVTVENFLRVLTGRIPPSTPRSKRLLSDDRSNILIYMTGHGGNGFLKFQDSEEITNVELADAFEQMWQKRRYNELLFIIDTCQGASMYERFYSPNIMALASSQVGEDSLSHQPDLGIGVHLMDRYTFYVLEFLEEIHPASQTNMNDLFQVCPKSLCVSTPGHRTDLFQRDPQNVLITDFFGSVRKVEITAERLSLDRDVPGLESKQWIAVLFIFKVTVTLVLVIINILQALVYFIFYFHIVFISGSYALVHTI